MTTLDRAAAIVAVLSLGYLVLGCAGMLDYAFTTRSWAFELWIKFAPMALIISMVVLFRRRIV